MNEVELLLNHLVGVSKYRQQYCLFYPINIEKYWPAVQSPNPITLDIIQKTNIDKECVYDFIYNSGETIKRQIRVSRGILEHAISTSRVLPDEAIEVTFRCGTGTEIFLIFDPAFRHLSDIKILSKNTVVFEAHDLINHTLQLEIQKKADEERNRIAVMKKSQQDLLTSLLKKKMGGRYIYPCITEEGSNISIEIPYQGHIWSQATSINDDFEDKVRECHIKELRIKEFSITNLRKRGSTKIVFPAAEWQNFIAGLEEMEDVDLADQVIKFLK